MGRVEYCVMKDGNNIECFSDYEAAEKFAIQEQADTIEEVHYGPRNENLDEAELSSETVWERD